MGTKPIRGRQGDVVNATERWDGVQEITVWPDTHLTIIGAHAYRLYYYLWNHQNVGINSNERNLSPRKIPKWAIADPSLMEHVSLHAPLGDLTSFLRHAEPTDNVLPVIREGMKSLLALKNIEVTNKNMPSNSSIPIRLRLAGPPRLLLAEQVVQEEDEEIPF